MLLVLGYQILHDVINIEPLTVPKSLAEAGYTGEVAANRLRDNLNNFVKLANSSSPTPDVALQTEIPDIVVPTFGLSLNAIALYIRNFLGIGHHREISGELCKISGKLALSLRMNGLIVFQDSIADDRPPDDLFKSASSAILNYVSPYIVAAALFISDPEQALQKANSIIALSPPSDENVLWAYSLKAMIFNVHGQHQEAEAILTDLIRQHPSFAIAHQDLGLIFKEEDNTASAIREFRNALIINPSIGHSHDALGELLYKEDSLSEAVRELRIAARRDPTNTRVRYLLGAALLDEGSLLAPDREGVGLLEEACRTFILGIYLKPNDNLFLDAISHVNSHLPQGPRCSLDPVLNK